MVSSLRQRFHPRRKKFLESFIQLFNVAAAREDGCQHVFLKPLNLDAILAAVSAVDTTIR